MQQITFIMQGIDCTQHFSPVKLDQRGIQPLLVFGASAEEPRQVRFSKLQHHVETVQLLVQLTGEARTEGQNLKNWYFLIWS